MSREDLVGPTIRLPRLAMLAREAIRAARRWRAIRRWRGKSFGFFAMPMGLNAALPGLFGHDANAALNGPRSRDVAASPA